MAVLHVISTLGTLERCGVSWAILPYVHPDSLTVEDR